MQLYDYLLYFPTVEIAKASLPEWYDESGELTAAYPYSGALATNILLDDQGSISDGYYLVLTLPEMSSTLYSEDYCLLETARPESMTKVKNCVIRSKLTDSQWSFFRPEPEYAGALYDWSFPREAA